MTRLFSRVTNAANAASGFFVFTSTVLASGAVMLWTFEKVEACWLPGSLVRRL